METATREHMLALINKKYPKLFTKTTEEFNGSDGGIWSGAEDGLCAKDGFELFNYYAEDYSEKKYVLGVHKEIGNLLESNGWYAEWYDAGTIMFWKI
jgi:hypothetical protein